MNPSAMNELFRAVREQCSPATWSKGVELARQDSVTGDTSSVDEITLRVRNPDRGVSQTVRLFPNDEDWSCDCGGDDDPCRHVAAAVIALRRAQEQGLELPRSSHGAARLSYRFLRTPAGLAFERMVIDNNLEEPLTLSLSALAAGRISGPKISATKEDLAVDLALGSNRRGVLTRETFPALLAALKEIEGLTLDGVPIKASAETTGLCVRVSDEGPGVKIEGIQDPEIDELFSNGIALCGQTLKAVARPKLDPFEQEVLTKSRIFGPRDYAELTSERLPRLESKMKVIMRSMRLPRSTHADARLMLDLNETAGALMVTPIIVYGDPPIASVRSGRLIALKGGELPQRNQDAERRLKDEAWRQLALELDVPVSYRGEKAVQMAASLAQRWRGAISGNGLEAFKLHPELDAQVTFGRDADLQVAFASGLSSNKREADPAEVMASWSRGESLVPLMGGGYAPLPKAWLTQHGALVADLLQAREAHGSLSRALAPALLQLSDDLGLEAPPSLERFRALIENFAGLPAAKLPPDLKATLRNYQLEGTQWLSFLKEAELGGILADDMGLGKTLQTIAVMSGRTLVVAPSSVAPNWLAELQRFRPSLKTALYHGPDRQLAADVDVTITTYAILRLDADKLAREAWNMAVLDEAQMIKNPDSQVAKAACKLQAGFRVALTGTPLENRLDDLWSQLNFVTPGLFGSRTSFLQRYTKQDELSSTLQARLKPFLLRRLKKDVAKELPPRTDVVLHVELTPEERTIYDAVLATTRSEVVSKLSQGGSVIEALEALLRLRQAACHPDLLPGISGRYSSKTFLLLETLQEIIAEGHKALVFSQWTGFLDLLEPGLEMAGIKFLRLDGSTSDRDQVVRSFQDDNGPPVLIMSLKAGGVGLNLTAADHVFILDPWWNPAAEDQAADRAHRIGQTRPVLVHRLVSAGTVEEKILLLQEQKRALAASVLSDQGAVAGLTRENLMELLS